ncbi:hypothetical protein [Streptomyces sp. NPDC001054]
MSDDRTQIACLRADLDAELALAADATAYRVLLPEDGGVELRLMRQSPGAGTGWSAAVPGRGGGIALTREGWQDAIGALSRDELFCWPDPRTAIDAARRALVPAQRPEGIEPPARSGAEFFGPGRIYDSQDGFTAPEDSWRFDCRHVTTTPDGERIAFGFVRVGLGGWTPTGLGRDDWQGRHWTAHS